MELEQICQGAKAASRTLATLGTNEKNQALIAVADALIAASVKTLGLLNGYLGKYDLYDLYDEVTGEVKKVPDEDEFFDEKYITF